MENWDHRREGWINAVDEIKDDNHREVTDQHECETLLINSIINASFIFFFVL